MYHKNGTGMYDMFCIACSVEFVPQSIANESNFAMLLVFNLFNEQLKATSYLIFHNTAVDTGAHFVTPVLPVT